MGVDRDTLAVIEQLVRRLGNRIANTISRGVVHLTNDAKQQQLLQVGALVDETISDAEHFHPYGFSSVPLEGAETVVVFPNGDRGHPLVVATSDRRHRPTGGEPGEVTVYNNTGASIRITKDGDIVVTPAAGRTAKLGSETAVDGAIKGATRNTAEQTFLTALNTYALAIKSVADPTNAATPTLTAAITAFKTAVAAAVSTRVTLE